MNGRKILAVCLLAAGWGLAIPPAVRAEQHPNLARGFSPGDLYDYSGIDSINLFNGGLNLNLPIGPRYPVGDGLSYGLHLSYASNTWEPEAVWLPEIRMHPRRSANAGHGWMLSIAGTLYRRFLPNFSAGLEWESPDGSEHLFYGSLHVGEGESDPCFATRDNTYLKLCTAPPRTIRNEEGELETLERYTIEFPDGTIQTYEEIPVDDRLSDWDDERFQVVRIEDRLGNWVTVDYVRVVFTMTWTIADRVGRTHTVKLTRQLVDGQFRWRANRAFLSSFEGGTAQYDLVYELATIDRSCKTNPTVNSPMEFAVPLLREVVLPAGAGSYRMPTYNSECSAPNWPASPLGDLPGTLVRLDLPTGGRLAWTYRDHNFIVPDPSDPAQRVLENSTGVGTKRALNAAGGCDSGPLSACEWSYSSFSYSDETRRMQVDNPVGDRTVHWFRQRRRHDGEPLYVGWDYGLPFSTETEHTHAGLSLSRQIYKGASALQREIYVAYEHDRLIPVIQAQEDWRNSNTRVFAERTRFWDDTVGGVPRFIEVRHDEFDGHGHYRRTVRTGDFRTSGESQTTTTTYNPARGTYQIDPATNTPGPTHSFSPWPAGSPWVLGTYTSMRVEEPGTAIASQSCFESSTGRLLRQRVQASSAGPGADDVIVEYTRTRFSADDIRYQELTYGGDIQTVDNGSLCGLDLPATPVYRTRHTHRYGVPARTEPLGPGGASLGFDALDLVIDKWTGLPSSSTDPAGLSTNYRYDVFGRFTGIRPVAGGDAWTEIFYETASGTTPARVTVTRYANGSTSGTALEQSRYIYDPFGRVKRDQRQIAGHGWTVAETGYNAIGWKTFVTERGVLGGGLPHRTWFLQHDAFGRPQRIELPDYPSDNRHFVKLTYAGTRAVTREVSVGSDLAGGETRTSTTELYDHLGRLWRVQEPSGPGGAVLNTTYGYDAASRLAWARQADTDGFVQARDFINDGRGFLLSERHPENGWTVYSNHDAGGHAGRKRVGPMNGPFDLGFTYDAAGRLTRVREWGTGRSIKEYTYGTGASAFDRSRNKIKTAVRHNWINHPTNGNLLDVTVTETYTYGGTGGRPSVRTTALNTGQSFIQTWAYDDLGQVSSMTYPTCTHGGSTCSSGGGVRPRTVSFTRQLGYLTAVPGWAGSITYHPNGMLHEVHHANGVAYGQGLDPHWMRRPGSLGVDHPLETLSLAPGDPPGVPLPYAYDGAGNIKSWYDWRYRYDPASRILEGSIGGGDGQSYTFDVYGNLRTITTRRNGVPQTVALGVDRTTNRLSASLYDTAGNLTSRGGFAYSYDALSMMQTMAGGGTDNTYIYTADDERIWTVDASVSPWDETFTLRDLDGKVLRVFNTTTGFGALAWSQDYVHRDGQLLATARVNGGGETRHHFHLDHLGTPLLVTNPQGGTEALHSYFPFGEELNPNADTERMKFTGHERDLNRAGQGDDLDYMHARYCSPMLGRFLAVDPKERRTAQPRPQGWNRYAYALGNPLKMVDLDGKEAITFTIVTEIRASRVVAPAPAFPPLQAFNGGVKTAQRFTVETSATKSPEPIISSIGAIGETKRLSLNSDQVLERGRAPLSGLAVGSARDSDGNALVIAGASSANPLIPGAPPITYGFLIQAGQSGEGFTFSGTYGGFPSATVTATNESGQTVTVYEYDEGNSPAGAFSLIPGIGDQTLNQTCSFGKAAGCEPTLQ